MDTFQTQLLHWSTLEFHKDPWKWIKFWQGVHGGGYKFKFINPFITENHKSLDHARYCTPHRMLN